MAGDTILVVEDEVLVGLEIKEDLENLGFRVPEVVDRGEAVESAVETHRPDLMIMDIHLRGAMDGVDAALRIKEEYDLPVIFLTAYSDEETLRRVSGTEPDGFILKPFDEQSLTANVRIALARAQREREIRKERRFLESSAEEVNESLLRGLPSRGAMGSGYEVRGFLDPCPSGSGDLYGVFRAGEGKWAFYGLDIMGHGLLATVTALSLRDALPSIARSPSGSASPPEAVMRSLYERYCCEADGKNTFFTIAYGLIDEATGEYTLVRAGHTPVLHIRAAGGYVAHFGDGMAVGLCRDAAAEESRGVLRRGDRLLVLSDGLLEALGGDEPVEGTMEDLAALSSKMGGEGLESFVSALRLRAASPKKEVGSKDDMSLLAIERI